MQRAIASTRPPAVGGVRVRPARSVPVCQPWATRHVAFVRRPLYAAAAVEEAPVEEEEEVEEGEEEERSGHVPFPSPVPMDPAQQTLSSIPLLLFYPGLLAAVAGSAFLGNVIGQAAPVAPRERPLTGYAAAALAGAAAAYGAVQAKKKRDSAAVVDLYNSLVEMDDPNELTPADVQRVGAKYGINFQRDELDGLKRIYARFLETLIPVGDVPLTGDEAPKVAAFREALDLSEEDAAPVHIEVGRRLERQGSETRDRQAKFEQRKAFQRLIYVSQLVFGDQKAAFLLPWRRVFGLNESQLIVARRSNAKEIFVQHMEARGGDLPADRHVLRELREFGSSIKLFEESAREVVKEYSRRHVERGVQAAIDAWKAPGNLKDTGAMVAALQEVLDYSRRMAAYANEDDLIQGLGHVSIGGGALDVEGKMKEVRELFRAYLDEMIGRAGEFTEALDADVRELQVLLNLGAKEAASIREDASATLYRRLLKAEVTSKRLEQAASPAAALQVLCEKSRFSPEGAMELHRSLYKQKVTSLMAKGKLTAEDGEDLKRIRRFLCLPAAAIKRVQRETGGRVLQEAIEDVYMMGAKPVVELELEKISNALKDYLIEEDVALEIMREVTRAKFKSYVQTAQKESQKDRKAAAASLRKLVQFNGLVVTPVLDRVKGVDAAKKELAELMAKAVEEAKKEEAKKGSEGGAEGATDAAPSEAAAEASSSAKQPEDAVASVQKAIQASKGDFLEEERKGQTEISLKDDVDVAVRGELYKTFLMASMGGDIVELPVGGVIRKKSNPAGRQQEMARLQQLSEVLGMTQAEVATVHGSLSEQAYKAQAEQVMQSGALNEERRAYLSDLATNLGLPKDQADKVNREVQTAVYGAAAAEADGKWTLQRAMDIHKQGGSLEGVVEEVTRRNMFRRELERSISDGTGELDADFLLKQVPEALQLEGYKVKQIVKELVATRRRLLLVQAVSQLRQKRLDDTCSSLSNLVSCSRAMPEDKAMEWTEQRELRDLYALYCSKVHDAGKQGQLAHVFGLSASDAAELQAESGKVLARASMDSEEEAFF